MKLNKGQRNPRRWDQYGFSQPTSKTRVQPDVQARERDCVAWIRLVGSRKHTGYMVGPRL
jgi:hypothetical protein